MLISCLWFRIYRMSSVEHAATHHKTFYVMATAEGPKPVRSGLSTSASSQSAAPVGPILWHRVPNFCAMFRAT